MLEPFADADDYTALIGPVPSGVDVDLLCESASAKVRNYCGWLVGPSTTETLTLNGSGTSTMFLPTLFMTGLTAISDCGVALNLAQLDWAAEGWVQWAGCDPYPRAAGFGYPGVFSARPRGVVASIVHGFPEVPADVVQLVCEMVARHAASPTGVIRAQVGQESVSYSQGAANQAGGIRLLQSDMAGLDEYRIPRVR